MHSRPRPVLFASTLLHSVALLLAGPISISAQDAPAYQTPDPAIVQVVDAEPTPSVSLSPDESQMLLIRYPGYPSIASFARRELKLAGLRLDPASDGRSRTTGAAGLGLVSVESGATREVTGLPEEARIENVRWSPHGTHISFTHDTGTGLELWVVDVGRAAARRLTDRRLSLTAGNAPAWLDASTLVAAFVPDGRGPEPIVPAVPIGPVIEEATGRESPARTYQDLLGSAHDEALFDHYLTVQLGRVDLGGAVRRIAEAGIVWDFSPSPDGRYLLVEWVHRPYSYRVPVYRFPQRVEILDRDGSVVHQVAELPLQEEIPIAFGSVAKGPRSFSWRADAPATLLWAEAQDGGDARVEAEVRDKLYLLEAPFGGQPQELVSLGYRYAGVTWGDDDLALVSETWWKTRQMRQWLVSPGAPDTAARLFVERSTQDRYADPGFPDTHGNRFGRPVIRRSASGTSMFLISGGASEEGDRPFVDRYDLASGETTRLFRSEAPWFERPAAVLEDDGSAILTRRESPDDPPNFFVRELPSGSLRPITDFSHPAPRLKEVDKELIRYSRADGVDLSGTLYLPPGWQPSDGRLPVLLWAYPTEYKSADAAGQVTDSPYRFVRASAWSPHVWTLLGYAVLDDPSLPIIGEGDDEPNDTYVEQLVAGARAAVDELVRLGVGDAHRMAIGGHSYGAFMTANLLAHSDLFAAGIARSGAYNRTLTPFGFQAEERTYWEAPEVYYAMSPFMHADQVDEPILLIHGEMDNNSGTFPMQSERYFGALKGLGATARLVILPYESHGYRSRESLLHMLWEQQEWLDRYVKNAGASEPTASRARGESTGPAR
ncbi:MAG: prolyl oligopeptidase family serine peptidase [marine benthic group bacterium]|nr:prolyl oligopeptidase family serine peptidase [Gemmatimonadota bacterium]